MKLCTVVFGLLVACAVSYAQVQHQAPLLVALHPQYQPQERQVAVEAQQPRQKRSLLLGALGAGVLGAGILGAGAIGAGALGAGIIGAKAGLIGGALIGKHFSGRSYGGGYGYGGGYSHYGYGGGYGGYGGEYYAAPVVYGGYRSYPAYYVEDEWC